MSGAHVQTVHIEATNYANISPTAGHALAVSIYNSAGAGDGTITSVQTMSGTGGTGSVLDTFTIPSSLNNLNAGGYHKTSAYLLSCSSGVQSIKVNYNGGTTPGTAQIDVSEISGVSSFLAGVHAYQNTPGTATDAITSGTVAIGTIPAYLLEMVQTGEADVTAGTGFTNRYYPHSYIMVADRRETAATGSYAATATAATHGGTDFYSTTLFAFGETAPAPTISDAGDESYYNGETGVPITGTTFGASQGTGKVYISPTDNIADVGAVEQTVTAWGDTLITFTAVKGGLSLDTTAYLFVKNNAGDSNASGWPVQIESRPYVQDTLVDETGAAVASATGITMIVYHAVPSAASPNPVEVIDNVSTDGAGAMNQLISRGSLGVGDPVWIGLMKDGTPAKGTMRKVTPTYA